MFRNLLKFAHRIFSRNTIPRTRAVSNWTIGGRKTAVIPMKQHYRRANIRIMLIISGGIVFLMFSCSKTVEVPITKRKRRVFFPASWEDYLGNQISLLILNQYKEAIVDFDHPLVKHIEVIGNRLCNANGIPPHRFIVIDDPQVNAFVIMGETGTVFIFTGILPILANESGCAMIIGHELSHVLAHHATDATLVSVPLLWLASSLFGKLGEYVATHIQTLPRSRGNELEADFIGMHLMAKACFDINEAPKVMKRLMDINPDSFIDYFDTHPSTQKRIDQLQDLMKADEILNLSKSCKYEKGPKYNLLSNINYKKLPKSSPTQIQNVIFGTIV